MWRKGHMLISMAAHKLKQKTSFFQTVISDTLLTIKHRGTEGGKSRTTFSCGNMQVMLLRI